MSNNHARDMAESNPAYTEAMARCQQRALDRTEAFAAIRRAAAVARWHSSQAQAPLLKDDYIEQYEWCADQIRAAIRAAIGSEKA